MDLNNFRSLPFEQQQEILTVYAGIIKIKHLFTGCEHYQGREKVICFLRSKMSIFQLFFNILALVKPMYIKVFFDMISFSWENEENNGTLKYLTSI